MKRYYKKIKSKYCLRRKCLIISFVLIILFILGISIIISILSINEDLSINKHLSESLINHLNKTDEYSYYFRIDYTINKGVCQPLDMFNTSKTINSLQKMTNQRINNLINENVTINVQILKINVILENFEKIKQTIFLFEYYFSIFLFKWTKLVCNYLLELFIQITFPSYCDRQCQIHELSYLTSDKKSFNDLEYFPLKFLLFDQNSNESPTEYSIENVNLYQTLKYYEEGVYIQSLIEEYYLSISLINLNTFQIPILLSKTKKTLFSIKKSLDFSEPSSIYVSIVSLIPADLYLRHENSQIKISKYDQSILFRQDATFKLKLNYQKNFVAFQAINCPDYSYIGVGGENSTNLTLIKSKEQIKIDKFNEKFFFKLIPAY